MKRIFFFIFFTAIFQIKYVYAENLVLLCEYENKEWGTTREYEFDLVNKKWITPLGEKVDMAYTEDEIVFQSYITDVAMYAFQVDRKNGQGSIKEFDYEPIHKDAKEGKLRLQMVHSNIKYPDLSNEEKIVFSVRDYVSKTFKPNSVSELDCSKLEKSF